MSDFKEYSDNEYIQALYHQIHRGEPLTCPECSQSGLGQLLCSMCDENDRRGPIFCPHCEREIDMVTKKGYD